MTLVVDSTGFGLSADRVEGKLAARGCHFVSAEPAVGFAEIWT